MNCNSCDRRENRPLERSSIGSKKLNVGLISKFHPEKCGIAIYSNNLLKNLKKPHIKIMTIGSLKSKSDYKIDFKSFKLKSELARIVEKEKVDLLHFQHVGSYFSKLANLNFLLALKQKVPVIVTLHEVHYTADNVTDKILSLIEKEVAKKATIVIVHTPQQARFLKEKYRANNVICIYHGLELYTEHKRTGKNLLFFGIISRMKGLEYLIKAMNDLSDYRLTIAGNVLEDRHKEELEKLIAGKKNIKARFGWVSEEERWKYYQNADLVILPYLWAPFQSGIMHNAISVGVPVVVTKVGSLWEMAELFGLGEIVEPKESDELAEAIRKVFKNYSRYKKGVEEYRKAANWDKSGKKHMDLYKKMSITTSHRLVS